MQAFMSENATERDPWTRPSRALCIVLAEREARAILAVSEPEPSDYRGDGFIAYQSFGFNRGMADRTDPNAHPSWMALAEALRAFVEE